MTKSAIKYTIMYEFKKENANFPSKIEELSKYILKEERKKKLKKIYESSK